MKLTKNISFQIYTYPIACTNYQTIRIHHNSSSMIIDLSVYNPRRYKLIEKTLYEINWMASQGKNMLELLIPLLKEWRL